MLASMAVKADTTVRAGAGSSATLGGPPSSKEAGTSAPVSSTKKKSGARNRTLYPRPMSKEVSTTSPKSIEYYLDKRSELPTADTSLPAKYWKVWGEEMKLKPDVAREEALPDKEAGMIFVKPMTLPEVSKSLATQGPDDIADALRSNLLMVNTGVTMLVKKVKARDQYLKEAREETFKAKSALMDTQNITTKTAEALDEANERAKAAENWVCAQEELLVRFRKIIRQICEQIEKETPSLLVIPSVRDRQHLTLSDRPSREDARYIISILKAMQAKLLRVGDDRDKCIADGLELAYKRIRAAIEDSGVKDFPDPSLIFKYQEGEEKVECKLQRDAFRQELAKGHEYLTAKARGEVPTITESSNLPPPPPSKLVILPPIPKSNQPEEEMPEGEKDGASETTTGEEATVAEETIEIEIAAGGDV